MQRWIVLLAALATALATARLGVWQLDRAGQKALLQAALERQRTLPALDQAGLPATADEAAAHEHRAVTLAGHWLAGHTVFLENRQLDGRPGFHVLTPLALDHGAVLVVQRGWAPRDAADRTRVAVPPPPAGRVEVAGRLALHPSRLPELAPSEPGPIRQNLDLDAFARETGLPLLPFVVVQEEPAGAPVADGLQRRWPAPASGIHKHYGYAFQWFALSALVTGLYVWFQLIAPRRRRRRS